MQKVWAMTSNPKSLWIPRKKMTLKNVVVEIFEIFVYLVLLEWISCTNHLFPFVVCQLGKYFV